MQFILVRETWSHMSSVSGFDSLFKQIELLCGNKTISFFANDYQNKPKLVRWRSLLDVKKGNKINYKLNSPFVEEKHNRMASDVIKAMDVYSNALVLLSVTENQLSGLFNELPSSYKSRLVLFVHQPPAWFKLNWSDLSFFKHVNSVVCLCQTQMNFFKSYTNKPVFIIHHGVDLNFFKPNYGIKKTNRNLIFVGQWMRDFNTLATSFQLIQNQIEDVVLHCIVPKQFRKHEALYNLAQNDMVIWYNNITSAELLLLYQSSDLLYLPLIDATANNAISEATSCALPIVCTAIGGVSDYVLGESTLMASPGNSKQHAELVLTMLEKIKLGQINPSKIRKHAENTLSWEQQALFLISNLALRD